MPTSANWQMAHAAAEQYEKVLVPAILGPAARVLVDLADPNPGQSAVDIGCGSGAAASLLLDRVGPTGRVVGADINPGMIAVAKATTGIRLSGLKPVPVSYHSQTSRLTLRFAPKPYSSWRIELLHLPRCIGSFDQEVALS